MVLKSVKTGLVAFLCCLPFGVPAQTAGAFMEGWDDRMCKNAQQRADDAALNAGRQPAILSCMRQIIERDRARAAADRDERQLQGNRRQQRQPSYFCQRDALGNVRCDPW